MADIEGALSRVRQDFDRIRQENDRTGPVAERNLRWVGCDVNPRGWRTLGQLADDLELLLFTGAK